jgi:hypothetical protein
LRTNDKLDLSQITVRDLYNRIQSLNKDKKENQELTHPVKQKDDKCKDDKNKELMTMAEGTKQKFARPNIKESEERYQFYQNKVKNLRSQENPNNIDVAKAAIGYLEGLMGNYAQYALEDPNYQGFLRNDAECPAIIIRGRDFRHNQVQLEVMYPSKNKKLTEDRTTDNTTLRKAPLPHANARAIALAYDSYADMPTLNIDANTSAVPNNVTLPVQVHKTNKTDLIKPLLRDKKKKIRQSIYNSNAHYNPNTQLPNPQLFTYPPTYSSISSTAAGAPNDLIMMPQVFYAVPVQPVYVPVLQPSTLLFSEPVTTQQPFMAHSTFVMQSAATTASAASAEQSQAQYPAQSQPQAQAQYNIASLGNSQATTSKSKIVISYYNNSIIHINYGTNADSARKFLNCMRSVEKELKIDLFPSKDNETIIEIHLSRVQFGGRKGFISQAQFEIEEISVNADAPNLYSNNIKNIL